MAEKESTAKAGKNLHAGHRQRLKRQFLEQGEGSFNDHQLLELMLFFGIPRKDTNGIAHELLNRFGSFYNVLNASAEDLRQTKGMTDSAALLLHMMPAVMCRYQRSAEDESRIVRNAQEAAEFLRPYFFGQQQEKVYLLSMDAKGRVLGCDLLGKGSELAVGLDTRRMTQRALEHRAAWVVLAHSHPSGLAFPSHEDVLTTRSCKVVFRALNIELEDHVIFADDDYVSMRDSGLMD